MGLFDSIFGKEKVWQYSATLSINTPKYILEKHDEVVRSKSEPKLLGEPTGYNKFDGNKPKTTCAGGNIMSVFSGILSY